MRHDSCDVMRCNEMRCDAQFELFYSRVQHGEHNGLNRPQYGEQNVRNSKGKFRISGVFGPYTFGGIAEIDLRIDLSMESKM